MRHQFMGAEEVFGAVKTAVILVAVQGRVKMLRQCDSVEEVAVARRTKFVGFLHVFLEFGKDPSENLEAVLAT